MVVLFVPIFGSSGLHPAKTNAITQMAKTFLGLCGYADWSTKISSTPVQTETPVSTVLECNDHLSNVPQNHNEGRTAGFDLNYNIHIHLPVTRDQAVYDALFASLAKHIPLK